MWLMLSLFSIFFSFYDFFLSKGGAIQPHLFHYFQKVQNNTFTCTEGTLNYIIYKL